MASFGQLLLLALVLALVQTAAALPWLWAVAWDSLNPRPGRPGWPARLGVWLLIVTAAGLVPLLILLMVQDSRSLQMWGRVYAWLLHGQLIADALVVCYVVSSLVWPKVTAVALAAFRESLRQPMFWLILGIFLTAICMTAVIPFFTFGSDRLMTRELNYEWIILATVLFAVLTAGTSVSEEIEGRTAVTLMSKPVSRRQFLLGKFAGILLAVVTLTGVYGWLLNWIDLFKRSLERLEAEPTPPELASLLRHWSPAGEAADFLRGVGLWFLENLDLWPGLVLGACQVMILLAVAVALATRLPLIINMIVCVGVYVLGHLAPVLVQSTQARLVREGEGPNPVLQTVHFISQTLQTILPGFELFSASPVLVNDSPPPLREYLLYVGGAALYAVMYTAVFLIVGLILFEDRDLA